MAAAAAAAAAVVVVFEQPSKKAVAGLDIYMYYVRIVSVALVYVVWAELLTCIAAEKIREKRRIR